MREIERFRAKGDDGNTYLITVYEKAPSPEDDEAKRKNGPLRYLTENGLKVKHCPNGRFQIFSTGVMLTRM